MTDKPTLEDIQGLCRLFWGLNNKESRKKMLKVYIKDCPGKHPDDIATALGLPLHEVMELTNEMIRKGEVVQNDE